MSFNIHLIEFPSLICKLYVCGTDANNAHVYHSILHLRIRGHITNDNSTHMHS